MGGGAAGAIAAIHLERRAGRRVRVVIIEPRAELGGGVAYSTTDLGHLLNVRAECLSALPDQPGHFSAWAANGRRRTVSLFCRGPGWPIPRSLLGQVEHIRARACHVGPCAAGVQIALSNGTNLIVDRVVLATGPSPTTFPEGLGGGELRWIEDPWVPASSTAWSRRARCCCSGRVSLRSTSVSAFRLPGTARCSPRRVTGYFPLRTHRKRLRNPSSFHRSKCQRAHRSLGPGRWPRSRATGG